MEEAEDEALFMDQATFALADTNSDGKHSPEELARHLHREALAEFDLDSDGDISADEWAVTKPSADTDDAHFHQLDGDGDDRVSEKEAVAFITGDSRFRERFERLDENEDEHLYWEEYATAEPETARFTLFAIEERPEQEPPSEGE